MQQRAHCHSQSERVNAFRLIGVCVCLCILALCHLYIWMYCEYENIFVLFQAENFSKWNKIRRIANGLFSLFVDSHNRISTFAISTTAHWNPNIHTQIDGRLVPMLILLLQSNKERAAFVWATCKYWLHKQFFLRLKRFRQGLYITSKTIRWQWEWASSVGIGREHKMGEINEWFRVKIILNSYFDDHKAKAYVSVNKQWKNVRQFHKHLEEIFGLTKFILTTNDDIYLPGKWYTTSRGVYRSIERPPIGDLCWFMCSCIFSAKENISIISRGDTIV